VDQGQFSDPDFTSGTHQRENVQFTDKLGYYLKPLVTISSKKKNVLQEYEN
jgi:hypothetical protein